MQLHRRRRPSDATSPRQVPISSAKIDVKGLDFFYQTGHHALKDINLPVADQVRDRLHRPVGLRQVHPAARPQPDLRSLSRPTRHGRGPGRRRGHPGARLDLTRLRAKVGMVFQKPTPFPLSIWDNIAFGIKLYEKLSRPTWTPAIEWALRKAAIWDEVKDKLKRSGMSLSGGQQQRLCIARAIAVEAGGDPDGRALLGARSDLDGPRRGADPRAGATITASCW